MRRFLLLLRLLLPPVFLCRFCSPRPPETSSENQTRDAGISLFDNESGSQIRLREMYSATLTNNRREDVEATKMGIANLANINKRSALFTKTTHLNKISQPELNDFGNFTNSFIMNSIHKEVLDNFITSKDVPLRAKTDLSREADINKSTNVHSSKIMQTGDKPYPTFKQNLLTTTTRHEITKSKSQQDRFLTPRKYVWSPSWDTNNIHNPPRFRKIRSIKEKLPTERHTALLTPATPPEYMVHLFQLLSGTRYETLRNFAVTGFVNINIDAETTGSKDSRTHRLAFNVVIPHDAKAFHYAELKLYFTQKRLESSANNSIETGGERNGQQYKISIFETHQRPDLEQRQIAVQTIVDPDEIWLSFNVTSVVKNWASSGLRVLEVSVVVCRNCTLDYNNCNESKDTNRIDNSDTLVLNLDNNKAPLLVIFSRKHKNRSNVPHTRHIRDTTQIKEEMKRLLNKDLQIVNNNPGYKDNESLSNSNYFQGLVEFISTINDDSPNMENSKLDSLITNDLNKQSNTKQQSGQIFQAIHNTTFLTATDSSKSATNNLILNQSLNSSSKWTKLSTNDILHRYRKQLTLIKEQSKKLSVTKETALSASDVARMKLRRGLKARYRRHLESLLTHDGSAPATRDKTNKKKRNNCQRKEMYVDFEMIKWDMVIIFPRGYQAFECVGKCFTPISEYLTPTKHAIIQTLVHTSYPEQASRACCVPTKLDPISILYWDQNGDAQYEYTYDGMVVTECGCR